MEYGHLNPADLPLGTRVGPWQVLEQRGWGAYGAVYRAFGMEGGGSGSMALKLALHPGDARFAREVELLSRIHHPSVPRLVDHGSWQPPAGHRASGRPQWPWLTAAAGLGGAVALGVAWTSNVPLGAGGEQQHASSNEETRDGGTVAVGEAALTAPEPPGQSPSAWTTIAVDPPLRPLPGQRRTDAAGRCPGKTQIPINGGCWVQLNVSLKDCDPNLNYFVYKGACYGPALSPPRPSTSGPGEPTGDDVP